MFDIFTDSIIMSGGDEFLEDDEEMEFCDCCDEPMIDCICENEIFDE